MLLLPFSSFVQKLWYSREQIKRLKEIEAIQSFGHKFSRINSVLQFVPLEGHDATAQNKPDSNKKATRRQ